MVLSVSRSRFHMHTNPRIPTSIILLDDVHIAAVIDRKEWESVTDFVGHDKHVIVAKFNPVMFHNKSSKSKEKVMLCAIASLDCKLSVWMNQGRRPIVVVEKMFEQNGNSKYFQLLS